MSISITNVSDAEILIEYIYNFTSSYLYTVISERVQVFNKYGVDNFQSTDLTVDQTSQNITLPGIMYCLLST